MKLLLLLESSATFVIPGAICQIVKAPIEIQLHLQEYNR